MLRFMTGGDCWAWVYRAWPMANVVNATGMVGMIGFPAASCRLPIWRSVRSGLPSLKMMTPDAPAAWAFWTFTPKLHVPRWISAIRPGTKPLKSLALQPLPEHTTAVSMLDRLLHHCHVVITNGDSYRMRQAR